MIYNINFGIGWASSGVEYAQKYRAKVLRDLNIPAKFIFLDFMSNENIQTLSSNMDFRDEEIIWLYQYFTDIKINETTYTINDLKETLAEKVVSEEQVGKLKKLILPGQGNFITCYLKDKTSDKVDRAEFVINGYLVRKDYYTYTRLFSEFYGPVDGAAKVFMRAFYNEDGTIAYKEYIDGEHSMYDFEDMKLYSKEQFVDYFMKCLKLTRDDIVILDRGTKVGQAVFSNKGDSKLGVVIHAEHFSDNFTDDDYILWNNFYDYQFTNAGLVDFYITSTDAQNKLLAEQFKKYKNISPAIYTIPVGSIDALKKGARRPFAIITASRLANEKHVDWMVRAVIQAKKEIPELTFDIYGEGTEKSKIAEIINQHDANEYIHLRGHVDLAEVYKNYELFLSASQSEGFGLTLMEAVGSGLGMIGFDVNYGNPTFIKHGQNGLLLPLELEKKSIEETITEYAKVIVKFYELSISQIEAQSYEIAKPFLTENVHQKWEQLINEVIQ